MSEKVKLSKDGSSIDFVASESLPTSMKKFRQSPEIEGFYRFIFENDLQKDFDKLEIGNAFVIEVTKAANFSIKAKGDKENLDKLDIHDHTGSGKGLQIPSGGIASNAVTSSKIAANAVGTAAINDSSVTAAKIGSNAVTSAKINDGSVNVSAA